MAQKIIGVIMNGVSGGMGYRQHLLRNGFKTQWEQFIRHVVEDGPHGFDLLAGRPWGPAGRGGPGELAQRRPRRPARARPARLAVRPVAVGAGR